MFTRPMLLDAAMGTALQARGLPDDSLPEEWLTERPQEIAAVGVNCAPPSATLIALTSTVSPQLSVPLVVKPNAGPSGALLPPAEFAELTSQAWRHGARLVGGCCGTTAEHLRALHILLR